MKFLDLFAGIGGFRLGMESAGHECVGFCEIDKFARKSYKAIHNTEGEREYHDITAVSDEEWRELRGTVDVICGGFPCQAFSIAGKRKGFLDETRGTLFFEIARAAEQIKPRTLFLENVKGLLSSKTFLTFYSTIEILNKEIIRGTIWEEKFSPMSNWTMLSDNITCYLQEKLDMNLIYQKSKFDILSKKNLESVYEKMEIEVGLGLQKRLKYLATQILQTMKKSSYFPTEPMQPLGNSVDEWGLLQEKLCLIDNLKTMDMSMLDEMVVINGEIEKLLNKKSEENFEMMKLFTISTELKQTIDQKICTFVQEQNILLFTIKQWKLSKNFWKKVMSNLISKKENTYYVGTFNIILTTLNELGYDCEWQLLNSKNFGVPQNRERVFIIGHLRGSSGREVFPITGENTGAIKRVVNGRETHGHSTYDVFGTDGISPTLKTMQGGNLQPKIVVNINPSGNGMNGNVYDSNGLAPTLTTNKGEGPKIIQKPRGFNKGGEHEIAPTLSANSWHENNLLKTGGVYTNDSESYNSGVLPGLSRTLKAHNHDAGVFDGIRVRRLTPRECWRLQGFPDWAFDKAQEVNSNSQLYKQAGNSVTVNVIAEIARRLK